MTNNAITINSLQALTLASLRMYPRNARLYVQQIDDVDELTDAYPDGCEPCDDASTVGELLLDYPASASEIGAVDGLHVVGASLEALYTGSRREVVVVLYCIA